MSASRLSAILRSSASHSPADPIRRFSVGSRKNGIFKKIFYGEEGAKKPTSEDESKVDEAQTSEAASNQSGNSSTTAALKPPTPNTVRTPTVAHPASRRPVSAPGIHTSGRNSTTSAALQQQQQQQLRRPPIANRFTVAHANPRLDRSMGGGSLSRQAVKSSLTTNSMASRVTAGARPVAKVRTPAPLTPRTSAAPLRVAVQRARIDARNATRKPDQSQAVVASAASELAANVESQVVGENTPVKAGEAAKESYAVADEGVIETEEPSSSRAGEDESFAMGDKEVIFETGELSASESIEDTFVSAEEVNVHEAFGDEVATSDVVSEVAEESLALKGDAVVDVTAATSVPPVDLGAETKAANEMSSAISTVSETAVESEAREGMAVASDATSHEQIAETPEEVVTRAEQRADGHAAEVTIMAQSDAKVGKLDAVTNMEEAAVESTSVAALEDELVGKEAEIEQPASSLLSKKLKKLFFGEGVTEARIETTDASAHHSRAGAAKEGSTPTMESGERVNNENISSGEIAAAVDEILVREDQDQIVAVQETVLEIATEGNVNENAVVRAIDDSEFVDASPTSEIHEGWQELDPMEGENEGIARSENVLEIEATGGKENVLKQASILEGGTRLETVEPELVSVDIGMSSVAQQISVECSKIIEQASLKKTELSGDALEETRDDFTIDHSSFDFHPISHMTRKENFMIIQSEDKASLHGTVVNEVGLEAEAEPMDEGQSIESKTSLEDVTTFEKIEPSSILQEAVKSAESMCIDHREEAPAENVGAEMLATANYIENSRSVEGLFESETASDFGEKDSEPYRENISKLNEESPSSDRGLSGSDRDCIEVSSESRLSDKAEAGSESSETEIDSFTNGATRSYVADNVAPMPIEELIKSDSDQIAEPAAVTETVAALDPSVAATTATAECEINAGVGESPESTIEIASAATDMNLIIELIDTDSEQITAAVVAMGTATILDSGDRRTAATAKPDSLDSSLETEHEIVNSSKADAEPTLEEMNGASEGVFEALSSESEFNWAAIGKEVVDERSTEEFIVEVESTDYDDIWIQHQMAKSRSAFNAEITTERDGAEETVEPFLEERMNYCQNNHNLAERSLATENNMEVTFVDEMMTNVIADFDLDGNPISSKGAEDRPFVTEEHGDPTSPTEFEPQAVSEQVAHAFSSKESDSIAVPEVTCRGLQEKVCDEGLEDVNIEVDSVTDLKVGEETKLGEVESSVEDLFELSGEAESSGMKVPLSEKSPPDDLAFESATTETITTESVTDNVATETGKVDAKAVAGDDLSFATLKVENEQEDKNAFNGDNIPGTLYRNTRKDVEESEVENSEETSAGQVTLGADQVVERVKEAENQEDQNVSRNNDIESGESKDGEQISTFQKIKSFFKF